MSSLVYDNTVSTLQAALERAHRQGANGQAKPDRADAVRLTGRLLDIAMEQIRTGGRNA